MTDNQQSNAQAQTRWLQRRFLKTKLRCRECYMQDASNLASHMNIHIPLHNSNNNEHSLCILPDAASLRKYLTLFERLISESSNISSAPLLIITESVSDYMDFRNMSSSSSSMSSTSCSSAGRRHGREAAANNERTRILNLFQRYPQRVHALPDYSVHFDDDDDDGGGENDEWDLLDYPSMSVEDRSNASLRRAVSLLRYSTLNQQHHHHRRRRKGDDIHHALRANDIVVVRTADDATDAAESDGLNISSNTCNDDGDDRNKRLFIEVNIRGLVDMILERSQLLAASTTAETNTVEGNKKAELFACIEECEQDYVQRNAPPDSAGGDDSHLWSTAELDKGLVDGSLSRGKLEVTRENMREAFVRVGKDRRVFVKNFNRAQAIHNDEVAIQVLPQAEWSFPIGRRKLIHTSNEVDEEEASSMVNTDASSQLTTNTLTMMTGKVVGVLNRGRQRSYVATIAGDVDFMLEQGLEYALVVPMDLRIPKIRIHTRQLVNIVRQRLLVSIDEWHVDSLYPNGHLNGIIGPVNSVEVEVKCLLLESGIAFDSFSASALACLPPDELPKDDESPRRLDLRDVPIFSVDPVGCQDIDDAFHIRRAENGDIELGIHIADVGHFLKKDSPLDREAAAKATTFYLSDRRFDMLPLNLMHLCSLHGNIDRFAFSVIVHFSATDFSDIKSIWFGKTLMRNAAALTYEQADAILSDEDPNTIATAAKLCAGGFVAKDMISHLKQQLIMLTDFARFRKRFRAETGAVELQSSELKFTFDNEGNPVQFKEKKELEIHNTVAELMIMANGIVAEKIHNHFPYAALLRIHSPVMSDNFGELEDLFSLSGLHLDGSTNKDLASSLKRSKMSEHDIVQSLFSSIATRAMNEAVYICTGLVEETKLEHYGLGLQKYTHFTSPIRRYADLIVHRLLLRSIELGEPTYATAELSDLCTRMNHQNRTAKKCSMDCQKLFLSLYFQSHHEIAPAVIVGLRMNGFLAYIPKFDIKVPVYVCDKDGHLQINPEILGLPLGSGLPATLGFTANERCRMFAGGQCTLHAFDDEQKQYLEVSVPGVGSCVFRKLDVVTVQLSCNADEAKARISRPLAHLLQREFSDTYKQHCNIDKETITMVTSKPKRLIKVKEFPEHGNSHGRESPTSIYTIISSIEITPKVSLMSEKSRPRSKSLKSDRVQTHSGRFFFHNFRDLNKTNDENQRNKSDVADRRSAQRIPDEYEQKKIEREITSRMQRLSAEKRNSRMAKAGRKK